MSSKYLMVTAPTLIGMMTTLVGRVDLYDCFGEAIAPTH